jgi:hypothetical protein
MRTCSRSLWGSPPAHALHGAPRPSSPAATQAAESRPRPPALRLADTVPDALIRRVGLPDVSFVFAVRVAGRTIEGGDEAEARLAQGPEGAAGQPTTARHVGGGGMGGARVGVGGKGCGGARAVAPSAAAQGGTAAVAGVGAVHAVNGAGAGGGVGVMGLSRSVTGVRGPAGADAGGVHGAAEGGSTKRFRAAQVLSSESGGESD